MRRALAVALVALLAIAWPALSAEAAPDSYTIQDGDTLVAIGAKLGVPSDQIYDWVNSTVSLNGLDDADSLVLGQKIKLPADTGSSSSSATATVSQTTTSSSSTTAPSSKSTASGPGGSYTVQSGDTLLGIAAKQGVSTDQMLTWVSSVQAMNNMSATDALMPGQTLALPGTPAGSTSSTTTASAASTTSTASTSTTSTTSQTPITSTSAATAALGSSTSNIGATSSSGLSSGYNGSATSYGDFFIGKNMGCQGAGPYNANDSSIIAVGPSLYDSFPCGTPIEVCGPKGCIVGMRKDACPGCAGYHVDLSRAGLAAVCGPNSCSVRVRRLT